jgi:hypothetical protein
MFQYGRNQPSSGVTAIRGEGFRSTHSPKCYTAGSDVLEKCTRRIFNLSSSFSKPVNRLPGWRIRCQISSRHVISRLGSKDFCSIAASGSRSYEGEPMRTTAMGVRCSVEFVTLQFVTSSLVAFHAMQLGSLTGNATTRSEAVSDERRRLKRN